MWQEGGTIYYIIFRSPLIEKIGYDPLRAILAVKLLEERSIRQYVGVPEEIWYRLREISNPDVYYRRYICGSFPETKIYGNGESE